MTLAEEIEDYEIILIISVHLTTKIDSIGTSFGSTTSSEIEIAINKSQSMGSSRLELTYLAIQSTLRYHSLHYHIILIS
jgi:hypothetical protein